MRPILACLICAAMIATATPAEAQSTNQPWFGNSYFALSGNAVWMRESDTFNSTLGETGEVEYDVGWRGNAALGYMMPALGDAFRFELEGGYHMLGIDRTNGNVGGTTNPDGSMQIFSYMGNLYYDWRDLPRAMGMKSQIVPYIGGGIGGAYIDMPRNVGLGATDDSDNVFAFQAMAGISFVTDSMPNTDWSLGYRFFTAADPELGTVEMDRLRSNSFELGARWHF